MNRLTPKQREFAQLVAKGATYTNAYRQAYATRGKPATIRNEASKLANLPKVAEEIDRLQQPPMDPLVQAQQATVQALLKECQYGDTSRDRQGAMRMLGRMAKLL